MKKDAVIWSQAHCKYCSMAKQLLIKNGYTYTEKMVGLGERYTKQDLLAEVPNARSVPQIFINGTHIGGYEDLVKML